MIEKGADEDQIAQIKNLAEEAKLECRTRKAPVIKLCKHYLSDFHPIPKSQLSGLYEADEFPCPLCSKPSNMMLPVFPKKLRDLVIQVKDKDTNFDLVAMIKDLMTMGSSISQVVQKHCLNVAILDETATAIKHAFRKTKRSFKAIERSEKHFLKTVKDFAGFASKVSRPRTFLKSLGGLIETIGFGSMIDQFSKSMNSQYSLIRIADYLHHAKIFKKLKSNKPPTILKKKSKSSQDKIIPFSLDNYLKRTKRFNLALKDLAGDLITALSNPEFCKKTNLTELYCDLAMNLVI